MLTKKAPRRPSIKEFVHNFFVDLGTTVLDRDEKGRLCDIDLIPRDKINISLSTWL